MSISLFILLTFFSRSSSAPLWHSMEPQL